MISSSAPIKKRVPHLPFLDGLRGLAALYVLAYHCWVMLTVYMPPIILPRILAIFEALFENGHSSVCIFIVLSGFVLMLPILFSEDGKTMAGGIVNFMKRRARRIFPPYYAALILFGCTAFCKQSLPSQADFAHLTIAGVVSHFLLVHNLSPSTVFQIDPPMWSLATEWQIYFVFAALLIPLSRRIGLWWTLLLSGLLSLLPHFFFPAPYQLNQACPWFLALFQFGMIAAYVSFSNEDAAVRLRGRLPWGWLALGTYVVWLLLTYHAPILPAALRRIHEGPIWDWILDGISGSAAAFFLVYISRTLEIGQKSGRGNLGDSLAAILQSRLVVWLGSFSYSLYLCHQPILEAVIQLLRMKRLHLPSAVVWGIMPLLAIPISMAFSYLFYRIFERPFIKARKSTT